MAALDPYLRDEPPSVECLSYTHDRDFTQYKVREGLTHKLRSSTFTQADTRTHNVYEQTVRLACPCDSVQTRCDRRTRSHVVAHSARAEKVLWLYDEKKGLLASPNILERFPNRKSY